MNYDLPSVNNLLLFTLAYPPATGGASIYTQLLVEGLLKYGFLGNIFVLAEAYPEYPSKEILSNGKLHLLRLFPFRSEISRKNWLRYVKYIYQNLQFLSIPFLIKSRKITHLIIHCHYYYSPSLVPFIVRLIRVISSVKLIIDVRDPKLLPNKFKYLSIYDKIICSAENVYQHLAQNNVLKSKLTIIPIPLKITFPDAEFIQLCKNKFELQGKRYLFSAGGILKEKNLDLTLEVVRKLQSLDKEIILVIAGANKDWNINCQEATNTGLLKYIGVITNEEVIALAKAADLVINLSPIESPSRYILEAMAVGAKVLLPPGVPEFYSCCPENVMISDKVEEIVQQIMSLLENKNYSLNYDLKQHDLKRVIVQYLQILNLNFYEES